MIITMVLMLLLMVLMVNGPNAAVVYGEDDGGEVGNDVDVDDSKDSDDHNPENDTPNDANHYEKDVIICNALQNIVTSDYPYESNFRIASYLLLKDALVNKRYCK